MVLERARRAMEFVLGSSRTAPAAARVEPGREFSVLVLDESGSMANDDYPPCRLRAADQAARGFVAAKDKQAPRDRVGVVSFSDRAKQVLPPMEVGDALTCWGQVEAIGPGGITCLEAGLRAAEAMLVEAEAEESQRIVLLTDGWGGDPSVFAAELKDQGVVIDVVGIGGEPTAVNEAVLREVASTVNGESRYRFIRDAEALREHFQVLARGIVK